MKMRLLSPHSPHFIEKLAPFPKKQLLARCAGLQVCAQTQNLPCKYFNRGNLECTSMAMLHRGGLTQYYAVPVRTAHQLLSHPVIQLHIGGKRNGFFLNRRIQIDLSKTFYHLRLDTHRDQLGKHQLNTPHPLPLSSFATASWMRGRSASRA